MRTRRRFLQTCIALSGASLAGCSEDDEPSTPTSTTTTAVSTTASTPETDTATSEPSESTATDEPTETTEPTETESIDPETLKETGRAFVNQLAAGEYAAIMDDYAFSEQFTAQVDAEQLESIWTTQTSSLGQFVELAGAEYSRSDGYHVTVVLARFTGGRQAVRLVFDDTATIVGLFFPASGGSYSPPEYVNQSAFEEVDRTIAATETCSLPAKLTLPTGEESIPGVVLVHGSGPNDMDETLGPNKPFKDLAWGLASRGVAVLRYDKRTHACDVDRAALTLDEKVTDDALTALGVLRDHPRIDPARTVVVGHSIGAMTAPRIADRDGSVAGAVMLAGNARPLLDVIPEQQEYLFRLDGELSDEEATQLQAVEQTVERIRSLDISEDEILFGLGGRPFWRTVQEYDQVATAKELDVPLAIFQGERDYQVTVENGYNQWQQALGDRENVSFSLYPDLNHLFMPGEGQPSPAEYFQPNNVSRAVVEDVASWVRRVTGEDDQ